MTEQQQTATVRTLSDRGPDLPSLSTAVRTRQSRNRRLRPIGTELVVVDETKPWMRYAGMIESGDSQASQKIDEIVYGQKD